MNKQELVKRLLAALMAGVDVQRALTDAIAYINTTPSRDDVLWEAIEVARSQMCYLQSHHYVTTKREFTELIAKLEALKSAPNTRTDGTTSPERGTVEDRWKSALGDILKAIELHGSGKRVNRDCYTGRGSGDSARWTGEAAPVVECDTGSESMIEAEQPGYKYAVHLLKAIASKHFGDGPKVKPLPSIDGVLTQIDHLTASMVRERPTQEAPQPEKPGPTYSAAFKAEFVDRKAFGHPDIPTNCDRPTWSEYYWLLRALDARQGEK